MITTARHNLILVSGPQHAACQLYLRLQAVRMQVAPMQSCLQGGKLDDITVLIAVVESQDAPSPPQDIAESPDNGLKDGAPAGVSAVSKPDEGQSSS